MKIRKFIFEDSKTIEFADNPDNEKEVYLHVRDELLKIPGIKWDETIFDVDGSPFQPFGLNNKKFILLYDFMAGVMLASPTKDLDFLKEVAEYVN